MIIGIGSDIIEINRIQKCCENIRFLQKIFTEKEIELSRNGDKLRYNSLAGNFAVKEAVSKALGTGFRGFKPIDIEVLRDELGKPYVNLYGNALDLLKHYHNYKIFVSISHSTTNAIAYVIIENYSESLK